MVAEPLPPPRSSPTFPTFPTHAGTESGFLQLVGGPAYPQALDQTLPAGWFAQAVADGDATFQVDMPSVQEWTFTEKLAHRITRPVLAVRGADSLPRFVEGHELVRQWWPQAEQLVVPGATHMLPKMNPRAVADGLAGFFARHPLPVPA